MIVRIEFEFESVSRRRRVSSPPSSCSAASPLKTGWEKVPTPDPEFPILLEGRSGDRSCSNVSHSVSSSSAEP